MRRFTYTLSHVKRAFDPVPNSLSAPCSPVELGRMNTQFCHADSRPNTFVSSVSSPGKRRLASRPVSASGDRLTRSSMATRTSSSQSRSSGATVTRPSRRASPGPSSLPLASISGSHIPRVAAEASLQPAAVVDCGKQIEVEIVYGDLWASRLRHLASASM